MDIKYLTSKLLREAVEKKYQKQFDSIYKSWKNEKPKLTLNDAEEIYNTYRRILGSINMDVDAVNRFLYIHDGKTANKRKLELKDLQNIESLTFVELLSFLKIWNKFKKDIDSDDSDAKKQDDLQKRENEIKAIFDDNGAQQTEEKIEESKKMWYDTTSAKISEGSLRLYEIMNQTQAIRMGYYYQNLLSRKNTIENSDFNHPWCVTMRGRDVYVRRVDENGNEYGDKIMNHMENMYSSYRNAQGWTFYFVIDDSKPISDKYHIASIGVTRNNIYKVTSMKNDGDNQMDWDDIASIYPELEDHEDVLVPREHDTKELETKSIIDIINEIPGNINEFSRQDNQTQMDYIDAGGVLRTPLSWQMSSKEVRAKYINSTVNANVNSKFSNLQFIEAVLKTSRNHLEAKLINLGFKNGIIYLIDYYLKSTYQTKIISINNNKHVLLENRNTKKIGLFDYTTFNWVARNGVTYADNYTLLGGRGEFFISNKNVNYILQKYTTGAEDSKTLYALIEMGQAKKITADAYFFTNSQWNQLVKDKKIAPKKDITKISKIKNLEPEIDTDIKEYMFK